MSVLVSLQDVVAALAAHHGAGATSSPIGPGAPPGLETFERDGARGRTKGEATGNQDKMRKLWLQAAVVEVGGVGMFQETGIINPVAIPLIHFFTHGTSSTPHLVTLSHPAACHRAAVVPLLRDGVYVSQYLGQEETSAQPSGMQVGRKGGRVQGWLSWNINE